MPQLKVVMAQLNPVVGDMEGNASLVIDAAERAVREFGADIVVFPELMLTGYPPEDLLLRPSLDLRVERALQRICAQVPGGCHVVVGYPRRCGAGLLNAAGVVHAGQIIAEYAKQHLPNYQVFDEKRYFVTGDRPLIVDIAGVPVAITICEDIWESAPLLQAAAGGARVMLNLNASPYHVNKAAERLQNVQRRVADGAMPVVYVNMVGGQDELVFDGGSMVVDAAGVQQVLAPSFEAGLYPAVLELGVESVSVARGPIAPPREEVASIYAALVEGVRDYVNKNGFPGVVLGLSGGIDSALTLAIAVDALGAERVQAVMMPFLYTSSMSLEDAEDEARRLGVDYRVMPIEPIYDAVLATLADAFSGRDADTTEENIQARVRGLLLMALSNKTGALVLTTGNKSELAVGYSTLYGDMAGGFDVLKDVSKTRVFALSRWRNTQGEVIPPRVIERPPSAELAPDQTDQDSLPPYDELDRMLELYVEQDYSASALVAEGFDREAVERVIRMVDLSEYKRRQAPIGPRITRRGFGRDRRYPITSRWQAGD